MRSSSVCTGAVLATPKRGEVGFSISRETRKEQIVKEIIAGLKEKVQAEISEGRLKWDVFDLLSETQCQQCCLAGNGGIQKVKPTKPKA